MLSNSSRRLLFNLCWYCEQHKLNSINMAQITEFICGYSESFILACLFTLEMSECITKIKNFEYKLTEKGYLEYARKKEYEESRKKEENREKKSWRYYYAKQKERKN